MLLLHRSFLTFVTLAVLTLKHVYALQSLKIKGYKFFESTSGTNIPIKGVDYYPRPNTGSLDLNNLDLYTAEYKHIWHRDIAQLKELGANALRLYAVDPSKNHDEFMCACASAGIYVIVGMAASCKGCAITHESSPECYPAELKTRGQMIIRSFAKYDNVLGFSAGNEVNHVVASPETNAPCQKKFLRDMRVFINSCENMRQIPIGVVVADTDRKENAQYYNCRTDPGDSFETAEWYGLNTYVHCNAEDKTISDAPGFQDIKSDFKSLSYSIPMVLTEYGCLNPSFPIVEGYEAQRTFEQAGWIMEAELREYIAGGFVFEYSTENANSKSTSPFPFTSFGAQNYGLGYFSPENCDDVNIKCTYKRMPNFRFLQSKYNLATNPFDSEPKYDAFTPDATRTGVSLCPANFPKLADFDWAADPVTSLRCPEVNTHKCGVINPKERSKTTEDDDGSDDSTPNPTRPPARTPARTPSPEKNNSGENNSGLESGSNSRASGDESSEENDNRSGCYGRYSSPLGTIFSAILFFVW